MDKLIVILGPTASRKSNLAIKLAKKFNGEIVSADSRQVYRGMDIGTAKLSLSLRESDAKRPKQSREYQHYWTGLLRRSSLWLDLLAMTTKNIPHYMIDIIDPDQWFTVAKYKEKAIKIIKDIQGRNKIPFLVGGTGLYIGAIVDNLKIPQAPPNKALRNKLNKKSNQELIKELKKLDPEAALFLDPANKRRLIRALEVCLFTKKPFSKQQTKGKPLFDVLQIGLKVPREKLYKKIDQRVDQMVKAGLIDEVKKLAGKYNWGLPSMSGIGYKQIGMYLRKEINLATAIDLIKRDTHRYARRQITWFKRDKRIKWIEKEQEAEKWIKSFLLFY